MFYFFSEPLITHAFGRTNLVLAILLFVLMPVGASIRARFAVVLASALIWAAEAWFVVQTTHEALEAGFVWSFCSVTGYASTTRLISSPPDTKPLPQNSPSQPISGFWQMILFHVVWIAGYALAFASVDEHYLIIFICAWSFAFIWLAQTSLWPLMISYDWIGHTERKALYRKEDTRRKKTATGE